MSFDGTAFVVNQTTIRSRTLGGNLGSNHVVIYQAKRTVATRTTKYQYDLKKLAATMDSPNCPASKSDRAIGR